MRSMTRIRPLVWAALLLLPIAAAAQEPAQPERGERIMTAACTSCHDTRPIDTRALDEEGWTKQVKAEIGRGADVKTDDVRPLVDYLVKYHGPLPDGPGKELVLNICTQCHDLQRVRRERLTPEGWLEVLESMLNEGAPLSDKDLPDVLRYLARNFKPQRECAASSPESVPLVVRRRARRAGNGAKGARRPCEGSAAQGHGDDRGGELDDPHAPVPMLARLTPQQAVDRGLLSLVDAPVQTHAAYRYRESPNSRDEFVGFRVVVSPCRGVSDR
jgi:cytochrome c5